MKNPNVAEVRKHRMQHTNELHGARPPREPRIATMRGGGRRGDPYVDEHRGSPRKIRGKLP